MTAVPVRLLERPFFQQFGQFPPNPPQADLIPYQPLGDKFPINRVLIQCDLRGQYIQKGREVLGAFTLQTNFKDKAEALETIIANYSDTIVITHFAGYQSPLPENGASIVSPFDSFIDLFQQGSRLGILDAAVNQPLTPVRFMGEDARKGAKHLLLKAIVNSSDIPPTNTENCLMRALLTFREMRRQELQTGIIRPQYLVFVSDKPLSQNLFNGCDLFALMNSIFPPFETSVIPIFLSLGEAACPKLATVADAFNGYYTPCDSVEDAFYALAETSLNRLRLTDCVTLKIKNRMAEQHRLLEVFDDTPKVAASNQASNQIRLQENPIGNEHFVTLAPQCAGGASTFFVKMETNFGWDALLKPKLMISSYSTNMITGMTSPVEGQQFHFVPHVLKPGEDYFDGLEVDKTGPSARSSYCFHYRGSSIPRSVSDLSVPSAVLPPSFFAGQPMALIFERRHIVTQICEATGIARSLAKIVLSYIVGRSDY